MYLNLDTYNRNLDVKYQRKPDGDWKVGASMQREVIWQCETSSEMPIMYQPEYDGYVVTQIDIDSGLLVLLSYSQNYTCCTVFKTKCRPNVLFTPKLS